MGLEKARLGQIRQKARSEFRPLGNLTDPDAEASAIHKVEYRWVKGHAENPKNNRCDELAVSEWKKRK